MSPEALWLAADRLTAVWPAEVQAAARVLGEQVKHEQECEVCRVAGSEIVVTVLSIVSGPYSGNPVDEDLGRAVVELGEVVADSPRRCEEAAVGGFALVPQPLR